MNNTTNIPNQIDKVDFNYNIDSVPVFVSGNYGIAPWGTNNFPDATAKWIWYTEKSNIITLNNTSSPITIQYVYSNNTNTKISCFLNVIVDDSCDVLLNTIRLQKVGGSYYAEQGWANGNNNWNLFQILIQPGENLFEFKVVNNKNGPGGLLVSAIAQNKILFNSSGDWKFIPLTYNSISNCNLSQNGLIKTEDKSFPWGCLTLNGKSQYVDIGNTITGMEGLTFGCWFRSNNNKNYIRIIDFGNGDKSNNILLFIYDNGLNFCVYLMDNKYDISERSLSSNINDNKWHHVVITIQYKQSTLKTIYTIYLDNQMISSIEGNYPFNIQRNKCYLGRSNWSKDPYFNGAISNFVMYQKVISTEEINALYFGMIKLMDPKLYIYLPFSVNSVLDTLLNNYAGKTFNLPIIMSETKNENWTCSEQNNKFIGIKMENGMPICMSMDGKTCIESNEQNCNMMISNPVVPYNPVICSETQTGWCSTAKQKLLNTSKTITPVVPLSLSSGTPIQVIKPGIGALSALETNISDESLNLKPLLGGGKILSLAGDEDVNNLLIEGTFKLRLNLPNMPPYIKGKTFDMDKGTNPNYFYLCIEKLDNNCNIKTANNQCVQTFADNKKCDLKALTSYVQSNTYRLVLISSEYVLDSSIPIGKNSDFTLIKINNQIYLKNVQTGYMPSLYSNEMVLPVYGDMIVNSNSNINNIPSQLNNTLCDKEIPTIQTTGTTFVKCNINQDPGTYLITTQNVGSSSPIRFNINPDKTVSLNLLSFNNYGFPTKIYALTYCNYNVNTYEYIEKITNSLGTFLINMVCFEDTQNNNANPKNQLKFTVELINFPTNFIKNNSLFQIN
jgi:hypothetical protein